MRPHFKPNGHGTKRLRGVSLVNILILLAAIEVAAARAVLILGNPLSAVLHMDAVGGFAWVKFNGVKFKPAFRMEPVGTPYDIQTKAKVVYFRRGIHRRVNGVAKCFCAQLRAAQFAARYRGS